MSPSSADPVPRVETDRLVLRGWRAGDAEPYAAMVADAEVMRHLGGPIDAATAWRQTAMHAGHWTLRGYGNWAVQRREDDVLLGRVGLWRPTDWPGLEVGWLLDRAAWGAGYATEAARAAIGWAWATLVVDELISLIGADNARSVAVAQRLGMVRRGPLTLRGGRADLYALCRPTPPAGTVARSPGSSGWPAG